MTNAPPEPRIGTIQTVADGSRWRKTRKVGSQWGELLAGVLFDSGFLGRPPTEDDLKAMGYTRETTNA